MNHESVIKETAVKHRCLPSLAPNCFFITKWQTLKILRKPRRSSIALWMNGAVVKHSQFVYICLIRFSDNLRTTNFRKKSLIRLKCL